MRNVERNGYRNISVCDTHLHLIYPETIQQTAKNFREILDYFSFSRVTLCALTRSGHRTMDPVNNLKGLYLKSLLNGESGAGRIFVYGSTLNYRDERDTADGYLQQVQELYDLGVDGYKLLDGKPQQRKALGKRLDDPIFDKMYAFIEEKGMPVKMHLGDPPSCWDITQMTPYAISRGWFCDETYPTLQDLRDEVDGILTKFPKLKLCLAHFYFIGHDLEAATAFFEKWENVSFDLTPGAAMFQGFTERPEEWKAFFCKYADRLFFGSDTYNNTVPGDELERYEDSGDAGHRINVVRRMLERTPDEAFVDAHSTTLGTLVPMNLDDATLAKIYHQNHEALHPTARPVNAELMVKHATEWMEAIESGAFRYEVEAENALELANLREILAYYTAK